MSQLAVAQSQSDPHFVIKVAQGPNKGDTYKITPPGVVIGRDPSVCQIALSDGRMSRQQCRIDFKPEGIVLEDLTGKSTTLVNQQPVTLHALTHGDVISAGESMLIFQLPGVRPALAPAQQNAKVGFAAPKFGGSSAAPKKLNKNFLIIVGLLIAGAAFLFLYPNGKKAKEPKVAGPEAMDEAIEAVQKRQEELSKYTSNLSETDLYNKRSAQKHYIRGFRDFQAGKYTRAIEAFQTTLATDPTHAVARRYYRLAEKRRQDSVDQHMDLGNKYRQKAMYKMCIAEFEKVLQIINQPSHKKYQLAKEQIKECRLSLQQGGSF